MEVRFCSVNYNPFVGEGKYSIRNSTGEEYGTVEDAKDHYDLIKAVYDMELYYIDCLLHSLDIDEGSFMEIVCNRVDGTNILCRSVFPMLDIKIEHKYFIAKV